jgi:ABC-type Fe3+-hydroxamate transport system substrate-binding protein
MKPLILAIVLTLGIAACSSSDPVATATSTGAASATTVPPAEPPTSAAAESVTTVAPTTEPPTTTTSEPEGLEIDISFVSGAVEGGGRIEVPLGEPVVIRIDSDTVDEGHLHGYDIFVDLEPGATGVIEFVADIPGIFELELEDSGVLLADLQVAP